jgi:hypothetical protein
MLRENIKKYLGPPGHGSLDLAQNGEFIWEASKGRLEIAEPPKFNSARTVE